MTINLVPLNTVFDHFFYLFYIINDLLFSILAWTFKNEQILKNE